MNRREMIKSALAAGLAGGPLAMKKQFTGYRCHYCGFIPTTSSQLFCPPDEFHKKKHAKDIKTWMCETCASKLLRKEL